MYTKFEEMQVIYNLILDYRNHQKSAVEMFKEEGWKRFQGPDALKYYQERLNKSEAVLAELQKAISCFTQAYTPEQAQLAQQREQQGKQIFSEIRRGNADYQGILKEIAHNTYFSGAEPALFDIELSDDRQISNTLESMARSGSITKEQLILYDNFMTYLEQDPDYIEIARQNEAEHTGKSK